MCDGLHLVVADDGAVAVAVWPGDDRVVDPGELLPRSSRRCWVTFPAAGAMTHRSRVTGPCAAHSVETSKPWLYWHRSTTTLPFSSQALGDLAIGADGDVLDVVPGPEVGDGVQLAGAVVELGVRGEAAGPSPPVTAPTPGPWPSGVPACR
jgi:hypothetical protein